MSGVVIRLANEADIATLFDIRLAVTENKMSIEELAEAGITPNTVRDAIALMSCAWIATLEDQPAAFAIANIDEGMVFAMFVHPRFERRGLGALLMGEAERCLFQRHETIWLTTGKDPSLRAHGFYISRGWRSVGAANARELRYEKVRP